MPRWKIRWKIDRQKDMYCVRKKSNSRKVALSYPKNNKYVILVLIIHELNLLT